MIHPDVIRRAAEIQRAFQQAKPFRHVAIDNFLVSDSCESLLRDFPVFDEKRATNELGRMQHESAQNYVELHAQIEKNRLLESQQRSSGAALAGSDTASNAIAQASHRCSRMICGRPVMSVPAEL